LLFPLAFSAVVAAHYLEVGQPIHATTGDHSPAEPEPTEPAELQIYTPRFFNDSNLFSSLMNKITYLCNTQFRRPSLKFHAHKPTQFQPNKSQFYDF
jgi:hypothetical protein